MDALNQTYIVKAYVANEGQKLAYYEEHRFVERPDAETLTLLFGEAKRKFDALYPKEEPVDCEVSVRLLPQVVNVMESEG